MQQSEYMNDSLNDQVSILKDLEVDQEIEKKELEENVDDLQNVSNITFNFEQCTQFEMDCPAKEIIIAISKYFMNDFSDVISNLGINLVIKNNKILITTEKDEKEYEEIKNAIQAFYSQFKSARLYFDYDSQRSIHPSNYILKKCEESCYYLVKIKNIDNQLELYLVTKERNLNIVQLNIMEKFRGIRIFFQDVTNRMTQIRKNANYKIILTQLRVKYYGLRMAFEISKLFDCIEFQDTINKNQVYCSQIIGLSLPYYLQGKIDFAQKIYRYIANMILNLLIVFITFDPTDGNVKQARLLENIATNKQNSQNQFLCSSVTVVGSKLIAFLGHPTDLSQLFTELVKSKDKFSNDFVQSFQVGILTKNYDFSYEITKGTFSQIEEKLKKKKIIITEEDQFKSMKITEKSTFVSYCNLIDFLCRSKYQLTTDATEKKLQIEYEYIQAKLGDKSQEKKLFDSLEFEYSQYDNEGSQRKQTSNSKKQNRNEQEFPQKTQKQPQQQTRQCQQQIENEKQELNSEQLRGSVRNQNHPRCQKNQQQEQQIKEDITTEKVQKQPIDILFEKSENSNQDRSEEAVEQIVDSQNSNEDSQPQTDEFQLPSLGNSSIVREEIEQQIEFQQPIIQSINDTTQKTIVSQEYQKYFKQLIKQNLDQTICLENTNEQLKFGFIPIKKDQLFKLKKIPASWPIFENEQAGRAYCLTNNQHVLIQVRINEQAEISQSAYGQQNQEENYILLRNANQVYPMKKL